MTGSIFPQFALEGRVSFTIAIFICMLSTSVQNSAKRSIALTSQKLQTFAHPMGDHETSSIVSQPPGYDTYWEKQGLVRSTNFPTPHSAGSLAVRALGLV